MRVSRVEGSVRTQGEIGTEAKRKDKRIMKRSEFITLPPC